jgi:hypothetical protein
MPQQLKFDNKIVGFEDQSDDEEADASPQLDDAAQLQQQPLFSSWSVYAAGFATVFSQIVLGWNFGE